LTRESATDYARTEIAERAVRTQGSRLLEFIRKRVRTDEDAEDILQDVFYRLVASYNVTEPIEQLGAYLFTLARNRITDWYRKKKALPLPAGSGGGEAAVNPEDVIFNPDPGPDLLLDASFISRELADALADLPEEQREVFVMHELEGRSFREIAQLTGEPLNTLLSRKRYAVLALREALREMYQEII
jgi:RNA polymerase sigma factor (sigma-70 family)